MTTVRWDRKTPWKEEEGDERIADIPEEGDERLGDAGEGTGDAGERRNRRGFSFIRISIYLMYITRAGGAD
jgi:hypothetical protein